jgi:hypothetical protein
MEHIRSNGDAVANEFVTLYAKEAQKQIFDNEQWIKLLYKKGYKAAHPDDGWVNRKDNYVQLSHPHFVLHIEVGDLIALGTPINYRTVKVSHSNKCAWDKSMRYYYFTEVDNI